MSKTIAKPRVTRWFSLHRGDGYPVRHGTYECLGQISRSVPNMLWKLEYDGVGFLVPCPIIVNYWRGLRRESKD